MALLTKNNLFHNCLYLFFSFLSNDRSMFMDELVQVMVEAYRRDAGSKEQLIGELRSTKKRLAAEVSELKQALLDSQGETQAAVAEQGRLRLDVQRVQEQMSGLEAHLQAVQTERDTLDQQIQVQTHGTVCTVTYQFTDGERHAGPADPGTRMVPYIQSDTSAPMERDTLDQQIQVHAW